MAITIIIQLLLSALPVILKWLVGLLKRNQSVPKRNLADLNRITYYASQISSVAPQVGCVKGGALENPVLAVNRGH